MNNEGSPKVGHQLRKLAAALHLPGSGSRSASPARSSSPALGSRVEVEQVDLGETTSSVAAMAGSSPQSPDVSVVKGSADASVAKLEAPRTPAFVKEAAPADAASRASGEARLSTAKASAGARGRGDFDAAPEEDDVASLKAGWIMGPASSSTMSLPASRAASGAPALPAGPFAGAQDASIFARAHAEVLEPQLPAGPFAAEQESSIHSPNHSADFSRAPPRTNRTSIDRATEKEEVMAAQLEPLVQGGAHNGHSMQGVTASQRLRSAATGNSAAGAAVGLPPRSRQSAMGPDVAPEVAAEESGALKQSMAEEDSALKGVLAQDDFALKDRLAQEHAPLQSSRTGERAPPPAVASAPALADSSLFAASTAGSSGPATAVIITSPQSGQSEQTTLKEALGDKPEVEQSLAAEQGAPAAAPTPPPRRRDSSDGDSAPARPGNGARTDDRHTVVAGGGRLKSSSSGSMHSVGGLREPPPTPTERGSPAAGGPKDREEGWAPGEEQPVLAAGAQAEPLVPPFFAVKELPYDMGPAMPAAVRRGLASASQHPFLAAFAVANLYPLWVVLSSLSRILLPTLVPVAAVAAALAMASVVLYYAGSAMLSDSAKRWLRRAWDEGLLGIPASEIRVIEEQVAAAELTARGGSASRGAPAPARVESSGSSTGGGGGGALGHVKAVAGEVYERVLEAVEPAREVAGEVYQEVEEREVDGEEEEEEAAVAPRGAAREGVAPLSRA